MRCSCGEHDLPPGKPLQPCHFCRHLTTSQPVVIWEIGMCWYPICHACVTVVPSEEQSVSVHVAPPEMVARAHAYSLDVVHGGTRSAVQGQA
jgi:hypothetical protein